VEGMVCSRRQERRRIVAPCSVFVVVCACFVVVVGDQKWAITGISDPRPENWGI
jgi:hypothetical protein